MGFSLVGIVGKQVLGEMDFLNTYEQVISSKEVGLVLIEEQLFAYLPKDKALPQSPVIVAI